MDNKKVGEYWDENAENWTKLARMGYDRSRNLINSPAFFKILPNISKLKGLDIGEHGMEAYGGFQIFSTT